MNIEERILDILERISRIEERSIAIEEKILLLERNGISELKKRVERMSEMMSHRRPTWGILWTISALLTTCGMLLVELLRR